MILNKHWNYTAMAILPPPKTGYREFLQNDAENSDALYLLGVLLRQRDDLLRRKFSSTGNRSGSRSRPIPFGSGWSTLAMRRL